MVDRIKIAIYAVIVVCIGWSGIVEYQRWLNPLGLKPEANPKIQDGSQEFNPHHEWKSSIEPMPDEDGVRRYLGPYELYHHGKDDEVLLETEQLPTKQMGED